MIRILMAAVLLGLMASCASVARVPRFEGAATSPQYSDDYYRRRSAPSEGTRIQGMIGLTEVTDVSVGLDPALGEIRDDGVAQLPMIGGVFMRPLGGDRLKFGVEGGFTVGWENDTGVVAINNGNLLVVSDNNLFLMDIFVGPFAELFVGERIRVYGGAGPLLQYGQVDVEFIDNNSFIDETESGFGGGIYTRAGVEFDLGRGSLVGFGVRWLDSSVNLGGRMGDLDFQGVQFALTVTTGI